MSQQMLEEDRVIMALRQRAADAEAATAAMSTVEAEMTQDLVRAGEKEEIANGTAIDLAVEVGILEAKLANAKILALVAGIMMAMVGIVGGLIGFRLLGKLAVARRAENILHNGGAKDIAKSNPYVAALLIEAEALLAKAARPVEPSKPPAEDAKKVPPPAEISIRIDGEPEPLVFRQIGTEPDSTGKLYGVYECPLCHERHLTVPVGEEAREGMYKLRRHLFARCAVRAERQRAAREGNGVGPRLVGENDDPTQTSPAAAAADTVTMDTDSLAG